MLRGKVNTRSDEYYCKGLLENDSRVLGHIYEKHLPGVIQLVTQNNGSTEDAKDVFQEGLMVFYRKLKQPDFNLHSSFYSYLRGVCRLIWMQKSKKRTPQVVTIEPGDTLIDDFDLTGLIIEEEKRAIFREAFLKLGRDCQQVLQMFFDGKRLRDIAKKMSYSEKFAKRKKFLCKEKLVKLVQLDRRFHEIKKDE